MSISPPPSQCGISESDLDWLRRLAERERKCEREIDPEAKLRLKCAFDREHMDPDSEFQRSIAELRLKHKRERGLMDPDSELQRRLADNRLRREIDPVKEELGRRNRIAKNTKMGEKVLEQYNLRHKDAQYEIVQGLQRCSMFMLGEMYYHLNFLARPKNSAPDSQPQRFFAEFGYIRGSTELNVTECTILNMDPADPDDATVDYCARCISTLEIFHPRNGEFIGGRMGPGSVEWFTIGGVIWPGSP